MKHADHPIATEKGQASSHGQPVKKTRRLADILIPFRKMFHVPVGYENDTGFFFGEMQHAHGPTGHPNPPPTAPPHPPPATHEYAHFDRRIPGN